MAITAGKLGISKLITRTQSLGEFDIDTDGKIKFMTQNAGPTFTIEVKGRLASQHTFTPIANVVGSADAVVNVIQWDFLQINVTIYDSTSNCVVLTASGFNDDATALQSITVPFGTNLLGVSDLTFTSSDSSVVITGNTATNTIDIVSVGGGGGSPALKYTKTLLLTDWIGPSAGIYTLTIPFSLHGTLNPIVACYELNGSSYDLILIAADIDSSNNISLTATQTPDTRFIGKIVIE
jgi:hypothetical protein